MIASTRGTICFSHDYTNKLCDMIELLERPFHCREDIVCKRDPPWLFRGKAVTVQDDLRTYIKGPDILHIGHDPLRIPCNWCISFWPQEHTWYTLALLRISYGNLTQSIKLWESKGIHCCRCFPVANFCSAIMAISASYISKFSVTPNLVV